MGQEHIIWNLVSSASSRSHGLDVAVTAFVAIVIAVVFVVAIAFVVSVVAIAAHRELDELPIVGLVVGCRPPLPSDRSATLVFL